MKSILLSVSDETKARLDALRAEGYTLKGYIRALVERDLADRPTGTRTRKGRVVVQYRKPGRRWQRRTVPAKHLEKLILALEDEGAEILTRTEP